jgi:hypothetical protein
MTRRQTQNLRRVIRQFSKEVEKLENFRDIGRDLIRVYSRQRERRAAHPLSKAEGMGA